MKRKVADAKNRRGLKSPIALRNKLFEMNSKLRFNSPRSYGINITRDLIQDFEGTDTITLDSRARNIHSNKDTKISNDLTDFTIHHLLHSPQPNERHIKS